MRARHELFKKKYPDVPDAHGIPCTGLTNARPETLAIAARGEIRLRVVSYASLAAGLVEETADEIRAEATASATGKAALQWKLHAIPIIQETALQPDPLMAAADLWTFAVQMRHFFAEGEGRAALGTHQPVAIAACEANWSTKANWCSAQPCVDETPASHGRRSSCSQPRTRFVR